jgi:hypothetical protein
MLGHSRRQLLCVWCASAAAPRVTNEVGEWINRSNAKKSGELVHTV